MNKSLRRVFVHWRYSNSCTTTSIGRHIPGVPEFQEHPSIHLGRRKLACSMGVLRPAGSLVRRKQAETQAGLKVNAEWLRARDEIEKKSRNDLKDILSDDDDKDTKNRAGKGAGRGKDKDKKGDKGARSRRSKRSAARVRPR